MTDVDLLRETATCIGCDCSMLTLAVVKTILKIVSEGDNPPSELRINDVLFYIDDPDILVELKYDEIIWE